MSIRLRCVFSPFDFPPCEKKTKFGLTAWGLSRPNSRADEARLSGAGRLLLGHGDGMKSFSNEKNHDARPPVPWSVLLEVEKPSKGKGNKFRKVTEDYKTAMASMKDVKDVKGKDVTAEAPGWLCEVNSALGSVNTGDTDALRQWYTRWQQQSQQRNSQAKASTTVATFPLKASRWMLSRQNKLEIYTSEMRVVRNYGFSMFFMWQNLTCRLRCERFGCSQAGMVSTKPKVEACDPAMGDRT